MKKIIKYKGYTSYIQFNEIDRIFFGKIEGSNGLITFEGSTEAEAKKSFKYMVDLHLNDLKNNHRG